MRRLGLGVVVALVLAGLGWVFSCNGQGPTVTPDPVSVSPTPPVPSAPTPTPPTASMPWHPGRAAVIDIHANFVGNTDAEGRKMFDIFLPGLSADQQADWIARRKSEGATHLVLGAWGWDYPGYPVPSGTWTPSQFATFVGHLLDADHLIPIVMMNGDVVSDAVMDAQWPAALTALQSYQGDLMVVPCFECVGPGGIDLAHATSLIRSYLPAAVLGVEPMPQDAREPAIIPAGDYDVLLYESPHGTQLLQQPCTVTMSDCWLSQFNRLLHDAPSNLAISAFELGASDWYHGTATDADEHRLTAAALALCAQDGRTCSWGNGRPE